MHFDWKCFLIYKIEFSFLIHPQTNKTCEQVKQYSLNAMPTLTLHTNTLYFKGLECNFSSEGHWKGVKLEAKWAPQKIYHVLTQRYNACCLLVCEQSFSSLYTSYSLSDKYINTILEPIRYNWIQFIWKNNGRNAHDQQWNGDIHISNQHLIKTRYYQNAN